MNNQSHPMTTCTDNVFEFEIMGFFIHAQYTNNGVSQNFEVKIKLSINYELFDQSILRRSMTIYLFLRHSYLQQLQQLYILPLPSFVFSIVFGVL